MNSTKLIAFLLGLISLVGLLFFGFMAASSPFLSIPAPPPLDQLSPGEMALLVFLTSAPLAMIPAFAGLGLWFFVICKREAIAEWEAAGLPEREEAFQVRLDDLVRRLLDRQGDVATIAAETAAWNRGSEETQRGRLLRFLSECSSGAFWGSGGAAPGRGREEEGDPSGWGARLLGLGLFAFAGFCALWACLCAFAYLVTDVASLARDLARPLGVVLRPVDMVITSFGCLSPGLAALLGGLALRWLLRQEERRRRRHAAFRQRAREIAAESCLRRIEKLLQQHGQIARADVVCTLPELDGIGRGRLIAQLQAMGMLSRISLAASDLRQAVLTQVDLSGAILTGSDLSGAVLDGARLVRADLCGSRLFGADLRGTDATGAVLRQADLRQARLHRCLLRDADLRGADLVGANLWQADLTRAKLSEARVTGEQLRGAAGVALP